MSAQAHCPYCDQLLFVSQEKHGLCAACHCGFRGPCMNTSHKAVRVVKAAPPKAVAMLDRLIGCRDLPGSVTGLLVEIRDLLIVEDVNL